MPYERESAMLPPSRQNSGRKMEIPYKPPQHYEQTVTFNSPWLEFERASFPKLEEDKQCDVAIIGGGISGVTTLYYLLRETDKQVVLFEQGKMASQATGNNAALACVHIERPIQELVEEYGLERTRQTFKEVDAAWDLMLDILKVVDGQELLTPLPHITIAMTSKEVLLGHIEREKYHRTLDRSKWHYFVADDLVIKDDKIEILPIPKAELLQKLHIIDEDFIALATPEEGLKFGRLNSAAFCHKILAYLSSHYPNRFSLYEHTPISSIQQVDGGIELIHPHGKALGKDVILCTNGYKGFTIKTQDGSTLTRLQDHLIPREGYMAALPNKTREPFAQAFFYDQEKYADSPYFYLSHTNNFTVLGGPEFDEPSGVHSNEVIAQRAATSQKVYHQFLENTYGIKNSTFSHFWYGIMGYTSNGVRWVGEEQQLAHLWYNLGCNGIGITTSIGAAKRLVGLIQGHKLPPSLFELIP